LSANVTSEDFELDCTASHTPTQPLASHPLSSSRNAAHAGAGGRGTGLVPFENWYSTIVPVVYFGPLVWLTNGRTLGKWLTGIQIVSVVHERIGFWHALERALGYGASLLEGGSGFFQYLTHPNRQTVHDRIAETIVVRLKS
jgi:uncharacterized RDD family membrane protein YckC